MTGFWTDERLSFLRECAGEMPPRELAEWLGCSEPDMQMAADLIGVDTAYYERRTSYCVECGTYRLLDSDGECRVCRAKGQLSALEAEVYRLTGRHTDDHGRPEARDYELRPRKRMPESGSASEWERADDEHCIAIEEWELRRIRAAKNRAKMAASRARK